MDGGNCRGVCLDDLHAALGRWDDRGPWLDRRGFGGLWDLDGGSGLSGGLSVRRGVFGGDRGADRGAGHTVADPYEPALSGDDHRSGRDLVEPAVGTVERDCVPWRAI